MLETLQKGQKQHSVISAFSTFYLIFFLFKVITLLSSGVERFVLTILEPRNWQLLLQRLYLGVPSDVPNTITLVIVRHELLSSV